MHHVCILFNTFSYEVSHFHIKRFYHIWFKLHIMFAYQVSNFFFESSNLRFHYRFCHLFASNLDFRRNICMLFIIFLYYSSYLHFMHRTCILIITFLFWANGCILKDFISFSSFQAPHLHIRLRIYILDTEFSCREIHIIQRILCIAFAYHALHLHFSHCLCILCIKFA